MQLSKIYDPLVLTRQVSFDALELELDILIIPGDSHLSLEACNGRLGSGSLLPVRNAVGRQCQIKKRKMEPKKNEYI